MAWDSISIIILAVVYGSFKVVEIIKDERLDLLRAFFFLYGMLNIFVGGLLLVPIDATATPEGAMTAFALGYAGMNALFIVMTAWIYGVYLFERFFDKTQKYTNMREKL